MKSEVCVQWRVTQACITRIAHETNANYVSRAPTALAISEKCCAQMCRRWSAYRDNCEGRRQTTRHVDNFARARCIIELHPHHAAWIELPASCGGWLNASYRKSARPHTMSIVALFWNDRMWTSTLLASPFSFIIPATNSTTFTSPLPSESRRLKN